MARALELYDETRIDHFRGFAGYWMVNGAAETAMEGKWIKGPGKELFDAMSEKLGQVGPSVQGCRGGGGGCFSGASSVPSVLLARGAQRPRGPGLQARLVLCWRAPGI